MNETHSPRLPICCGWSFINKTYSVFEHGRYRRTPELSDILKGINWASSAHFDAIELMALTRKHFEQTYNVKNAREMRKCADSLGLVIPHFHVPFISEAFPDPNITSMVKTNFRQSLEIANILGVRKIAMVSSPYPDVEADTDPIYPGGPNTRIHFNRVRSWKSAWSYYASWIGELCDLAKSSGLKLALEPRPREIIGNTEGMLMLLNKVGSSNLGVLFDTAHHFAIKELLPVSIWKLGKSIFGVHMSDNDGVIDYHWSPGDGKIDWIPVLKALKDEDYRGYLTIDSSGLSKNGEEFAQARERVIDWLDTIENQKRGRALAMISNRDERIAKF